MLRLLAAAHAAAAAAAVAAAAAPAAAAAAAAAALTCRISTEYSCRAELWPSRAEQCRQSRASQVILLWRDYSYEE